MSRRDVLEKIEDFKRRTKEVEMYELMTTNQYRKHVAMIIEILETGRHDNRDPRGPSQDRFKKPVYYLKLPDIYIFTVKVK